MRTSLFAMTMSLLAAAATACEVAGETEELEQLESLRGEEVARAVTDEGGLWRFIETEPGELFVWATLADDGREVSPFDGLEQPSYVELYQAVTGEPAPRALREAQARADALLGQKDPSTDDGGLRNEEGGEATLDGRLTQQISAADFQDAYCTNGWDYQYCWPSFYGSPFVQRKTYSMWGYVAAVNNTVQFRYRYKTVAAGSWKTLVNAQALPGQVHLVYQIYFGYKRWRRWEVLNNGANLVRYAAMGSD